MCLRPEISEIYLKLPTHHIPLWNEASQVSVCVCVCPFYSLIYLEYLEECQAQGTYMLNICWRNKWMIVDLSLWRIQHKQLTNLLLTLVDLNFSTDIWVLFYYPNKEFIIEPTWDRIQPSEEMQLIRYCWIVAGTKKSICKKWGGRNRPDGEFSDMLC